MAKKATTLHDNLGNDLLPVTNASITFMDNGNSVQSEIQDLKLRTQYNKGHFSTPEALNLAYPSTNPDGSIISDRDSELREGWYAIVGSTDTVWIWDVQGKEWVNSGAGASSVYSVNGLDGDVVLTGGNINATATIDTTSTTKSINSHLTDIYSDLDNKVDLDSSQLITGTKVFTEVIGLANTSEGTVDQIKHINSNFLITSGTGQNLLNIDEGLQTISAFNRELAYEDEIAEIQGNYVTNDVLTQELQTITDMIPTNNLELTNGANYAKKDECLLKPEPEYIYLKEEYEKELNLWNGIYTSGVALNSSGGTYSDTSRYTSDFIEIESNKRLFTNGISWGNFYDSNQNNISQVSGTGNTSPSNAKYFRFSAEISNGYNIMISYVDSPYKPYYGEICRTGDAEQKFLKEEYDKTLNLIDFSKITTGYGFASGSAELEADEDWYVTDYCKVEPNTKYVYFGISSINTRIFDANKNLIEIQVDRDYVNVPSNGHYVRFNSLIEGYENPQLYKYNSENSYGNIIHKSDLGTLLWQNGNPNSSFGKQTITLSQPLSNFSKILITYKEIWYSETQPIRNMVFDTPKVAGSIRVSGTNIDSNENLFTCRQLNVDDPHGTTYYWMESWAFDGNRYIDDNRLIPIAIYGIK